jgi:hypothetical protein
MSPLWSADRSPSRGGEAGERLGQQRGDRAGARAAELASVDRQHTDQAACGASHEYPSAAYSCATLKSPTVQPRPASADGIIAEALDPRAIAEVAGQPLLKDIAEDAAARLGAALDTVHPER